MLNRMFLFYIVLGTLTIFTSAAVSYVGENEQAKSVTTPQQVLDQTQAKPAEPAKPVKFTYPEGYTANIDNGKNLYASNCLACHGDQGQGNPQMKATSLSNQDFQKVADEKFLSQIIYTGRGQTMPGFSEKLTVEEIADIATYIQTMSPVNPEVKEVKITASAKEGEEIYQKSCISCHGNEAKGGSATALADAKFLAAASDGYLYKTIEHGRTGTAMSGFSKRINGIDELDDQQIQAVIAYLRSIK